MVISMYTVSIPVFIQHPQWPQHSPRQDRDLGCRA
jgi:hypothetical protein